MDEPLSREDLDLLHGLSEDARSAGYPMPEEHQREFGDLGVRAWRELWRLQRIEQTPRSGTPGAPCDRWA